MKITKLRSRILATALTALAVLGVTSAAQAYSVYRRVSAVYAAGRVAWDPVSFDIAMPELGLRFLHFADDAAARRARPDADCFIKVDIPGINNPQPNTEAPIGKVTIPIDASYRDEAKSFPWMIVFNNDPAGSWIIPRANIGYPSNNAAARVAAAGFRSLATSSGSNVTVINGRKGDCTAQ